MIYCPGDLFIPLGQVPWPNLCQGRAEPAKPGYSLLLCCYWGCSRELVCCDTYRGRSVTLVSILGINRAEIIAKQYGLGRSRYRKNTETHKYTNTQMKRNYNMKSNFLLINAIKKICLLLHLNLCQSLLTMGEGRTRRASPIDNRPSTYKTGEVKQLCCNTCWMGEKGKHLGGIWDLFNLLQFETLRNSYVFFCQILIPTISGVKQKLLFATLDSDWQLLAEMTASTTKETPPPKKKK